MNTPSRDTGPCLVYREEAAAEIRRCMPLAHVGAEPGWAEADGVSLMMKALNAFHLMLAPANSALENAELFFYLSLEVGRRRPGLFPAADACLLAANLLMARHGEVTGKTFVCLDWTLFPAALLLAGYGACVCLPRDAEHENETAAMATLLARTIPGSAWSVPEPGAFAPPHDSLVLGGHPVLHTEGRPDFLKNLSGVKGGVFFCYWDFLDVALHAHVREQWLASGLLRSVVQLPRPRRQAEAHYPALVELGAKSKAGRADHCIRLALIKDASRGPGGLSQAKALQLLLEPLQPDCAEALDLSTAELRIQGNVDFKPVWHLTRRAAPAPSGSVRLSDVALVIRCQLSRAKVDSQEAAALAAEAASTGCPLGGVMSDGSFVCREIVLGDLDELTGFVREYGELTRLEELSPAGRQGKYLLRPDDILLAFRGAESSLGQLGFMEEDLDVPAVTGQSLCIVRAFGVDPVWLYYTLQRSGIRRRIVAQATGSKTLTVNLADLRDLPLLLPDDHDVKFLNEHHRRIVHNTEEIRRIQQRTRAELVRVRRHVEEEEKYGAQEN